MDTLQAFEARLAEAATIAAMAKKAAVLISPRWTGFSLCGSYLGGAEANKVGTFVVSIEDAQSLTGLLVKQLAQDGERVATVLIPWQYVECILWHETLDPKTNLGFPKQPDAIQSNQ